MVGCASDLGQKKGALRRLFLFSSFFLFAGRRQSALVPSRGVLVNQPFARGTVEKSYRGQFIFSRARRCALERRPKCGFLGAVADGSGARFPHVLFR